MNTVLLYIGVAAAALIGGYYVSNVIANNQTSASSAPVDTSGYLGGQYGIAPLSGGIAASPDLSTNVDTSNTPNAQDLQSAINASQQFLTDYGNRLQQSETSQGLFGFLSSLFGSGKFSELSGNVDNVPFDILGKPSITPFSSVGQGATIAATPAAAIPTAIATSDNSGGLSPLLSSLLPAIFGGTGSGPAPDYAVDPTNPYNLPPVNLPPVNVQTTVADTTQQSVAASTVVPVAPSTAPAVPVAAPQQTTTVLPQPPQAGPTSQYSNVSYGTPVVATPATDPSYATDFPAPATPLPSNYVAAVQPITTNGTDYTINTPVYYQTGTPDPGITPAPIAAAQVTAGNPLYVGNNTVGYSSDVNGQGAGYFQFANGTTIPGPNYTTNPNIITFQGTQYDTTDPESMRQYIQDVKDAKAAKAA